MSNEQWKTDGNCTECRRNNYCKTTCSAHKGRMNKIVQEAYIKVMAEKYPELNKILGEYKSLENMLSAVKEM